MIICLTWYFAVERVTRIELALSAWEADVLPLNYTRVEPAGAAGGTIQMPAAPRLLADILAHRR